MTKVEHTSLKKSLKVKKVCLCLFGKLVNRKRIPFFPSEEETWSGPKLCRAEAEVSEIDWLFSKSYFSGPVQKSVLSKVDRLRLGT